MKQANIVPEVKNKASFAYCGIDFTVTCKCTANGVTFPFKGKEDNSQHYKFKVTVKTNAGGTSFDFYTSAKDWADGKDYMDQSDLQHALYSFISDGVCSIEGFENFCSELGYDEDSRTAERIFKACEKAYTKLNDICPAANYYDLLNAINE